MDSFLLRSEPHKLCLIATGNIGNRELEVLFSGQPGACRLRARRVRFHRARPDITHLSSMNPWGSPPRVSPLRRGRERRSPPSAISGAGAAGWPLVCLAVFVVNGEARAAGDAPTEGAGSGAALAAAWCGGCHAMPEPAALDRETWTRNVLPEMGARLGIYEFRGRRWRPDPSLPAGTWPAEPLLPLADWAKVFDHYRDGSPAERLPPAPPPDRATARFAVPAPAPDGRRARLGHRRPRRRGGGPDPRRRRRGPPGAGPRRALRPVAEVPVDTPPVHFAPLQGGAWLVTLIGSPTPPAIRPAGRWCASIRRGRKGGLAGDPPCRRLPRPVRTLAADLDGDGLRDLVIAGFGHARGGISAHLARPGGGSSR